MNPLASVLPGRALLSWPVALSAVVLIGNDFYLKTQHPGWLSGKLSDFALCFFAPVWLYTLLEVLVWAWHKVRRQAWTGWRARWPIALACGAVGFWMSALQLWPWAARFHVQVLETCFGARMIVTPDPTDLLSLSVLPMTWWFLMRHRAA